VGVGQVDDPVGVRSAAQDAERPLGGDADVMLNVALRASIWNAASLP
jgi:hypothetical protein